MDIGMHYIGDVLNTLAKLKELIYVRGSSVYSQLPLDSQHRTIICKNYMVLFEPASQDHSLLPAKTKGYYTRIPVSFEGRADEVNFPAIMLRLSDYIYESMDTCNPFDVKTIRSTFAHEYVHYLDESAGQCELIQFDVDSNSNSLGDYFNSSHEMNAYWHQIVFGVIEGNNDIGSLEEFMSEFVESAKSIAPTMYRHLTAANRQIFRDRCHLFYSQCQQD